MLIDDESRQMLLPVALAASAVLAAANPSRVRPVRWKTCLLELMCIRYMYRVHEKVVFTDRSR